MEPTSENTTETKAVATGDLFGDGVRTRVDRPWNQYPVGTKAPAIMGGRWYRTAHGWKWNGPDGSGGTFPTPGGDNDGTVILPPNVTAQPCRSGWLGTTEKSRS